MSNDSELYNNTHLNLFVKKERWVAHVGDKAKDGLVFFYYCPNGWL